MTAVVSSAAFLRTLAFFPKFPEDIGHVDALRTNEAHLAPDRYIK
jgi:hypothetical protein